MMIENAQLADYPRMEAIARGIRKRVLGHVLSNNGGYLIQASSSAAFLASLYGVALIFLKL